MWFFLALKLMIPHPQPRCALWLEKNKVIFLTSCEALRRRGQFFRTVNIVVNNILSVNMSKRCCSIEKACYIGACIGPGRTWLTKFALHHKENLDKICRL